MNVVKVLVVSTQTAPIQLAHSCVNVRVVLKETGQTVPVTCSGFFSPIVIQKILRTKNEYVITTGVPHVYLTK